MSRRFATRLAQVVVVLVLGLWAHNTRVQANDFPTCGRQCDYCPVNWSGNCWAYPEYCETYGCQMNGICSFDGGGFARDCECTPCIG